MLWSLQHCSYALVNQRARSIPAGHGPFAKISRATPRPPPPAGPRHGDRYRRQRLASSPPWPRSSPSMRARPACAPSPWTSRPGSPTSPTGSSPSTSPARAGSSTTQPRSGRPCAPPWPRWGPACRGRRDRGGHRHHQPARDPGRLRPLDRPAAAPRHRLAGPSHRRHLRRARPRRATSRWCAPPPGLVLDPYFSATKAPWLLRHGDLALAADDPDLSFCTVDSLGAVEPDRRHRRRHLRHRPVQRQPHAAARYGHARLVPRALRPLRRAAAHARPRCAPRPAASAPPRWPTSARRPRSSTASRSRACWATSRPRSSGRPASSRGWSR